jgi:2-keto-myo-inositol isomerase
MVPALSQVCSLNSPFADDVVDYAAGQCRAVEVWLTKLETYLETHTLADLARLLDEQQVSLPVAAGQGGLLTSQGAARQAAWELFERRLAICREIGIETLVVACDMADPLRQADLDRARTSLAHVAVLAGEHAVRIALEFQARAAFGNNLQTAAALVAEVSSPHLGLCFDAFHYYVGPSKPDDLACLTSANLFHVQLCDLADVPREFAADSDRILPGDGDIPLAPVVLRLREIGYAGHVSVELFNPQLWQVPARQFGEIALTALRKVLGQASM